MIELENAACGFCGSNRSSEVFRYGDARLGVRLPEYAVCRCRRCGFVYLNPRPSAATVSDCYPSGYDAKRTAVNDATRARYETQARFVGEGRGLLLDVGCARGDFLSFAEKCGWTAHGIEPFSRSEDSSNERIRNIDVFHSDLRPRSFDVITAWHVMEHMYEPRRVFARIAELLAPHGRLCLSVPNFHSWKAEWLKAEDLPRHVNFFTAQSLRSFGERAGLRVTKVSYGASFADGATGRGFLTNYLYRYLGGMSLYDYHHAVAQGEDLARKHPLIAQIARPFSRIERWLANPQRLERNGRMGVVAVEFSLAGDK